MGTGYTRQSAAEIQTGEVIEAAPINAEFNQLQNAFDSTIGHTHDGTVGEGPKINLTSSVTGVLPVANGGSGGINKTDATTTPTTGDDSNDGYAVGSLWIDVTNDVLYVCVDATPTAAIWQRYTLYDAGLTSIAGLTTSANKMIYTTASDTYATTDLSAYGRTLIDDADASSAQTTLGVSTYIKTLLDDVDASTAQSTLGVSTYVKTLLDDADATTARATLGVTIGTNVQAQDTELQAIAGLVSAADRLPYFTGSGTASLATFTAAGRAIVDDADATAQRATLGLVIGTDVEAHDATLTALAAYNTNGILTQTAADTFTGRTLTGTANEVTVTNGSGVSGNPTLSLPSAMTFTGKIVTGGEYASPYLSGAVSSVIFKGLLSGLTLSNNVTDATNDIDIATGVAASDESIPHVMELGSALTKRLDAAWAVGTNQGGLDTGTIADGTYHIWLIQRSDTSVVDALFSTSATSPTMPANYNRKRRIGSIIRSGGVIRPFRQTGDMFRWVTPVLDRAGSTAVADSLLSVTVPFGITTSPMIVIFVTSGTNSTIGNSLGDGVAASADITVQFYSGAPQFNSTALISPGDIYTNTSSQIRLAVTITAGTIVTNTLTTLGYTDTRNRY
jgi:hypothetical protein